MTAGKIRIAGVNDEPSPSWDLDEGLDVLDELGIKFIELRAAYGERVIAFDFGWMALYPNGNRF